MKSLVSIILAMLIQFATLTGSVSTVNKNGEDALYNGDEIVNVIVELEDKSLLEGVKTSAQREKLVSSFQTGSAYRKLTEKQESIKEKIRSKISSADFSDSYSYSFVMNGFSLAVPYKYVSKIEKLNGVKAVEISSEYTAPAVVDEDSIYDAFNNEKSMYGEGKFTGVNSAQENGYTGKGTVIAVLDTGFDLGHEAFAKGVENPTLSKKDINVMTTFKCLNTIIPMYNHYKSEKIPYVWDYAKVDGNVKNSASSHGTHVAGIIAGNSDTLTGVAPDAQLLLMKVFDDKENATAKEYVYLAALDDAVKLGADAVNLSLSSPSGGEPTNIFTSEVLRRLEKSGVNTICSAGNEASTGYYDATPGSNTVRADVIDYGTVGSPSTYDWSMAVAAGCINSISSYNEAINVPGEGSQGIASYSAWGVTSDLRLKPEITAPGSNILSSVNGNSYEYYSGTSMASPYFAGCYALTRQYINENYPSAEKKLTAEMINSILMSTATPFRGYGQPALYSPRRQGSGLVNMDGALSTKAYLTKTDGTRPLISLGECGNELVLNFVVNNLSNETLEYKIDITPLTDSYKLANGENVNALAAKKITPSDYTIKYLKGTQDGNVTVAPNGKTEISLKLAFSDSLINTQSSVFTNGFFLDGFVYLKSADGSEPTLSLPYMGFYGDWFNGKLFDSTMYDNEKPFFDKQWGLYVTDGTNYYPMGANMFESEKEYGIDSKYCAYSKSALSGQLKKPYVTVCLGVMRNVKRVDFNMFAQSGIFRYCGSTLLDYIRKTYNPSHPLKGVMWGGRAGLIEGNTYEYKVSTRALEFDSGRVTVSFPFTVDNTAPKIRSFAVTEKDGIPVVSLSVSDNHYIQGFRLYDSDGRTIGDVSFKGIEPVDGVYNIEKSIYEIAGRYISSDRLNKVTAYIVDYAYNETTASVEFDSDKIVAENNSNYIPVVPEKFLAPEISVDCTETQVNYGVFDKTIKKLQSYLSQH